MDLFQPPRGHEEVRASFPNQIHKSSHTNNIQIYPKEMNREREGRRGDGLGKQRIHGHNTKAALDLTQVKGYLYPRDRSDRYAGPVRPVG